MANHLPKGWCGIDDGKDPIIAVTGVVQGSTGDTRVCSRAGATSDACRDKQISRSLRFTAPLRVVA